MRKLDRSEYRSVLPLIDRSSPGCVYPLSVAEGTQPGEIYSEGNSFIIHHHCGFAFVCGDRSPSVFESVYRAFLSPESAPARRFLLFAGEQEAELFKGRDGIRLEKRLFFEYRCGSIPQPRALPDGFELRKIDPVLTGSIRGRITPSFSWDSAERFIEKGSGFCLTEGETPAAWAFSAAVSSEETDIGAETDERFRRRGFAAAAAEAMIKDILSAGKRPVWACHYQNTASVRLAESLGFEMAKGCITIRKSSL